MNDFKALDTLQNINVVLVSNIIYKSIYFSHFSLLISDNFIDCLSKIISVSKSTEYFWNTDESRNILSLLVRYHTIIENKL